MNYTNENFLSHALEGNCLKGMVAGDDNTPRTATVSFD